MIQKIRLSNFRCYENLELNLRPRVNLLIGDNASGKTSFLRACKYALSSFFSGFSDENTHWLSPTTDDFRELVVEGIIAPEKPVSICFKLTPTDWHGGASDVCVYKRSKKNSRPLTSKLGLFKRDANLLKLNYFDDEKNRQSIALPLFVCFSTEDIHSSRKIDSKLFKNYYQKSSFGYYECLKGNGLLRYWIDRMLVLVEGAKNEDEIAILRKAVSMALGENGCNIISSVEIRPNKKKVYFKFIDGREVSAENLSDGYRRLVNIVIELAFRCAFLNKGLYGVEAALKTKGTVLIDEIDMHLHPSLQSCVLQSLSKAFPCLQFVATTHAPLVMANLRTDIDNGIFKLDFKNDVYSIEEVKAYGLDISTIVEAVLKQPVRAGIIAKKLDNLFVLIDQEKVEDARKAIEDIRKVSAVIPELARAEALLSFLE